MLKTKNPLLKKTELAVRARVPAKFKPGLERVLTAGLSMMYSQGGAKAMKQQLQREGDPAFNVAEGAAKLVGVLFHQSRNTMPTAIAVAAATLFMLEGLDFLEKAKVLKVTPDVLASATQEMGSAVLQLFGVTPEKLQQMAAEKMAGKGAGGAPAGQALPQQSQQPPAGQAGQAPGQGPAPQAPGIVGGAR